MDEKHQHRTPNDINIHSGSGFHANQSKDIKDLIGTLFSLVALKAEVGVLVLAPENKPGQAYLIKKDFAPGQFEALAISSERKSSLCLGDSMTIKRYPRVSPPTSTGAAITSLDGSS